MLTFSTSPSPVSQRGDALIARGAALLASSPSARLWAITVVGPAPSHGTLASIPGLLAAGADPSYLSWSEEDYVAMALAALRACSDHDRSTDLAPPVCSIHNRYSALHGAALSSEGALVSQLARAASSVDVRGLCDTWTPLHAAIGGVCPSSVKALLLAGAHPLARIGYSDEEPLQQALTLPRTPDSQAIIKMLRDALAGAALRAPPVPPPSGSKLRDSATHEISYAARSKTIVHTSAPPISVPTGAMTGCSTCGKHAMGGSEPLVKMSSLFMCSACHKVYYCSRECQRADWAQHKPACLAARAAPSLGPSLEQRPTLNIYTRSLGHEPSPAVIAAAAAEFHAKLAQGLMGKDNPCPTFFDASGQQKWC
jgi:hypothetical protein